jgi:methanogenic corrinoid protein MtbC1
MVNLLDRSAAAYAKLAADRLLAGHPEIAGRYGGQAQAHWRFNLTQRVNEFAAAVELETPTLFAEGVRWSRETFVARNLPEQDLRASLDALREVLLTELPDDCTVLIEATMTPAFRALDGPPSTHPGLDPQQPLQRLALAYIETCLDGEPARATRMLLDAIEDGLSIPDACLGVIVPSMAEVGRLWHIGRLGMHEEHAVTAVAHRALGLLAASATHAPRNGKTVIGATVQGNAHDTAIRIVTLLFEIEGWKSVSLGTELPPGEVANSVRDFDAHLAVLSATLIPQLRAMGRTIAAVRSASPETRILVGGQAFTAAPELARTLGADAFSSNARDVVSVGAKLVGLK